MSDIEIINLYKKGYSIEKIAKIYKNYEKMVFKKTVTLFCAKQIVNFIIYTYNKSVYKRKA